MHELQPGAQNHNTTGRSENSGSDADIWVTGRPIGSVDEPTASVTPGVATDETAGSDVATDSASESFEPQPTSAKATRTTATDARRMGRFYSARAIRAELVTIATPTRITGRATAMWADTDSSEKSTPNNTAIAGFTYA